MIKINLFFNILFVFCCLSLQASNFQDSLKDIPPEDILKIESMFHDLVNKGHFAYSLFGDKPVSLLREFMLTPWENTIESMRSGGVFWNKWAVWEKYKHKFILKNYLLIKEKDKNKDHKISAIFLINKKEFTNIINQHLKLFEKITRRSINPEKLLNQIERGETTLTNSINNSDILLGILLGYGAHNAILYDSPFPLKLKSAGEYHYLPLFIESIYFACDINHPETQTLQKKYKKLRGEISKIYSNGNFLEITLSKLTEE